MFLKYTIKLSKAEAETLRKLKEQEGWFSSLPDFWVLFNDYKKFANSFPFDINKIPLIKNRLGLWGKPLTSISKFNNNYIFLVEEEKKYKDKLIFSCGSNIFSSTLGIEVGDTDAENILFSLSTVYTEWINNASRGELACKLGDILYIASFFQNNLLLYKKIQAILILNKKQYVACFGSNFVEDLILLFSASKDKKLFPHMKIGTTDIDKTTAERLKISKKEVLLGTSPFYRWVGKCWAYTDLDLKLLLNNANNLVIVVYPTIVNTYSSSNLAEAEEKNEFVNFIKKYLNDWINQLISTINLASNIYDSYKAKILFEQF